MTIFALTSLCSFIFAIFLGAFLLLRNPRHILNRLYFTVIMSVAWFSMVEFGYRISPTYEDAVFWWRLDVLWPVHTAAWLHFAMAFTERENWLRHPFVYLAIYGPALTFILLDIFFHAVTGPPVLEPWGWSYSIQNQIIGQIVYIWMVVLPVISAALYIQYYRQVTDTRKKRQSRLMLFAGVVPLISLVFEIYFHFTQIKVAPFAIPAFILANIFVAVAIWKYELFTLTPSRAAEGIIATMTDSLVLAGLDTKILTANQATCDMLGYRPNELQGKPVSILFDSPQSVPECLRNVQPSGAFNFCASGLETVYAKTSGDTIPVSLAGSKVYDDNKNIRGFLLIARDITLQKEAADKLARHQEHLEEQVVQRTSQLQTTNERLQQEISERLRAETEKRTLEAQLHQSQKMEAIGRLAGGIAHDFNNLLFVINGYATALVEEFADQPDLKSDMNQILEAGNRAGNLTRQLLAFSRKQIIDPVTIDMNERLFTSSKMFSRMIGEHISIRFLPCDGPANVVMDVTQLDQIIANLLVNAKDAMPKGGTITIRTAYRNIPDVSDPAYENLSPGEYVALTIQDTGCGIPKDHIEKIFEPFYTSKERGKGTGLGLATVYGIAQQNQGCVSVESEVNRGTTFTIVLPSAEAEDEPVPDTPAEAQDKNGSETVLLVEDSPAVRRLARRQLEAKGYHVVEAEDAATAITIYSRQPSDIDVILTDVVMPEMSGVQMIDAITRQFGAPKVLFMSGYNDDMIDAYGIHKKRYTLLAKPFTADQLCTRIRGVIDDRQSLLPAPPL